MDVHIHTSKQDVEVSIINHIEKISEIYNMVTETCSKDKYTTVDLAT
jgi:hypothetical protein